MIKGKRIYCDECKRPLTKYNKAITDFKCYINDNDRKLYHLCFDTCTSQEKHVNLLYNNYKFIGVEKKHETF